MTIVFSNDFLFHGQDEVPSVLHLELFSLLSVAISEGTGIEPVLITRCQNAAGEEFSRTRFYELSGVTDPAPSYYLYDIRNISSESWEYFQSFFGPDTVFVASEFGMDLREKLTELGITYVNFWFHPYKLLNDAFFLVGTNSEAIYKKLENYRVPQARLRFYCRYYSHLAERKHFLDDLAIEDNCCVFAGQTYKDKSISNGTRYLNITDYPEKVAELARTYSRVYYVPHPSAGRNPEVDSFLSSTPGVEVLENVPTYYLLASPKVKKVVALSSSVLYEAHFFGKETEYLFKPLFKIDEEFSLNSFVSIYQDYFSPSFWRDLFGCVDSDGCLEEKRTFGDTLMARDAEMFRDLLGVPFGYRFLGRMERIESRFPEIEAMLLDVKTGQLEAQRLRLDVIEECLRAHSDAIARDEASQLEMLRNMNRDLSALRARMQGLSDSAKSELDTAVETMRKDGFCVPSTSAEVPNARTAIIAALCGEIDRLKTKNDELSDKLESVSNNAFIRLCIWTDKMRRKILGF
jgi:hypothetical protein